MLRSMYSGISGLRVHQTKLDAIGNNIANVNTVGFKASRTVFQEVYNQTLKAASAPTANGNRGGTNPMQIGLGVSVAAIDVLHTSSGAQRTDKATDLAIEGDGFFVVADGDTKYYTRAGNFDISPNGYLVSASGLMVQGWTERDQNGDILVSSSPDSIKEIRLDSSMHMPANQTSYIDFAGNLDSRAKAGDIVKYTATVIDSQGNEHPIILEFEKKDDNSNEWTLKLSTPEIVQKKDIDGDGKKESAPKEWKLNPDDKDPDDKYLEITLDNFDFGNGSAEFKDVKLRFDASNMTQQARESSIKAVDTDGYGPGTLDSISIDSSGRVIGVYTNGRMRVEAIIAVASFNNPAGLTKVGNNLFYNTPNSGEIQLGQAGTGGLGSVNPGALEMSNVDLANEFTEMITAQRGFQANSRIITTSDELLQELVNLKR